MQEFLKFKEGSDTLEANIVLVELVEVAQKREPHL